MENVIHFILMPIVWIPIVGILAYLTYRNYKKLNKLKVLNVDSVLLMLEIPRTNDKKELAAEQLFASLHGILRDRKELKNSGGVQEHLSFEIVSTAGQIRFYVWVPKVLQSFVEGQIYAQYPTVQIYKMSEDYADNRSKYPVTYLSELTLTDSEALPIKTFDSFEVDPLAGITGTLAKLNPDRSEEMWIQILARPIGDDWHKNTTDRWIQQVRAGKNNPLPIPLPATNINGTWFAEALMAFFRPPAGGTTSETKVELSERAKAQISKAEEKATKLGYEVKIRLAYLGQNDTDAKLNMQALVGTFKQYNSTSLNGFQQKGGTFDKTALDAYKTREFADHGFILNISELASVYHLPHTSVETPNIVWANAKTAEPPAQLPVLTGDKAIDENISAFGLTNFRGINHQFGLQRIDRSRHVYIIGQTGAGKSGMLELLALSDVFYNQGYCIIDPHGDFAIDNLKFIPESRVKDVVYFNPADTAFPVAFNPLEYTDPSRKPNICSEVIGVLKRMFGDSWGPRLEHILRYTLLALLDRPSATLLDISRMLTDKEFRKETLDYCQDVTVLQFWKHEFGQWNDKQINESIAPVLNKVGAFTANPIIRNIIGQPRSSFDIRKIMDEGKILVVNLSKGLIGEDNASILGSFLVTKVQLAAMSRSDIPRVEDRRPFYLYVDEFQNFATDSFAVILSEARKYGLNLTVANQYVAQMTENVRDAVFGNVGTTICFRVSAEDAPILDKQFEPTFDASDLLQLNNRHFVISMIVNGEKVPAFSATTLSIPATPQDNFASIIEYSRVRYGRPREEVEAEIRQNIEQAERYKKELSDSGRQTGEARVAAESKSGDSEMVFIPLTEHKPNTHHFRHEPTPQGDFRKAKLSPNTAEGKNRPGLKDLARLVEEHNGDTNQEKTRDESKKGKKFSDEDKQKTGNNETRDDRIADGQTREGSAEIDSKASNRPAEAAQTAEPNDTAKANKNGSKGAKKKRKSKNQRGKKAMRAMDPHVRVEFQEKSPAEVPTSKRTASPDSLSTPVNNPDNYASKDTSADGFLSVKH
ncbi:MAG: type IV secretion system DNA-binding domain-containing protein [Candidatus Saccharibacteria bacterium]|nr:type IV secretion system DNA-binding domain-containing protein [Candidatus Saccharibacteria bacterium]